MESLTLKFMAHVTKKQTKTRSPKHPVLTQAIRVLGVAGTDMTKSTTLGV